MFSDRIERGLLAGALLLTLGAPAGATVLVTVDEALRLAFPDCELERETVFLTEDEVAAVGELSNEDGARPLAVRHVQGLGAVAGGHDLARAGEEQGLQVAEERGVVRHQDLAPPRTGVPWFRSPMNSAPVPSIPTSIPAPWTAAER